MTGAAVAERLERAARIRSLQTDSGCAGSNLLHSLGISMKIGISAEKGKRGLEAPHRSGGSDLQFPACLTTNSGI